MTNKRNRDSLQEKIESKIKTTMIGSIASIEEEFGFLFGHGKESLTKEEHAMYKLFQQLRTRILDLGNEQIKRMKLDLDLFEVKGPVYKYTFKLNPYINVLNPYDKGKDNEND